MRIINLIEDSQGAKGFLFEHGLCFYVETAKHKLLLDTGATHGFLENAKRKSIDLEAVDTVVISHGHYDHTGGLLAFAAINPNAKIYIHKNAAEAFYNLRDGKEKYIGMDPGIAALPQVVWLEDSLHIDEELFLFSGVTGRKLWPRGNEILKKKQGDTFLQDSFDHEQYLVICEGEKRVLLSGCAHNGILNILERYRALVGGAPTHVISGFHTTRPAYTEEDIAVIEKTAGLLAQTDTAYYTGHCTGALPMEIFKRIMGEKLIALHSGDEIL